MKINVVANDHGKNLVKAFARRGIESQLCDGGVVFNPLPHELYDDIYTLPIVTRNLTLTFEVSEWGGSGEAAVVCDDAGQPLIPSEVFHNEDGVHARFTVSCCCKVVLRGQKFYILRYSIHQVDGMLWVSPEELFSGFYSDIPKALARQFSLPISAVQRKAGFRPCLHPVFVAS